MELIKSYLKIKNPSLLKDNNKLTVKQKHKETNTPFKTPNNPPSSLSASPITVSLYIFLIFLANNLTKTESKDKIIIDIKTEIENIYHIDRGCEAFEAKFSAIMKNLILRC